jgi:integrase
MEKLDIHNRKQGFESFMKRFNDSKDINKQTILKYYDWLSANGLSIARIDKEMRISLNLSKFLGIKFENANKDDIIKLVQTIEKQGYAEWTKCDYKVIIKKFYSWLRGLERKEYPLEVKWIKTTLKNKNNKLPDELLTKKEVQRMIDVADHPREKAFVSMLYESGCRIGEIATLQIKNITFDNLGCVIKVSGKTGDRRIRLVESTRFLARWISSHPNKNNPESPLWVGYGDKNNNKILCYNAHVKNLKLLVKKAEIQKKVYPHLFRHSRATELASHLTEFQLKKMFGWSMSSDMASVYVNMSGRDIDDAILKLNGIKKEKKELEPLNCPYCHHTNPSNADMCEECGHSLDIKGVMEEIDFNKVVNKVLDKNPKLKNELFEKVGKEMKA